jgi:diadenosine tetraphosphate (Ap4A) HIT family hydrolase
MAELTPEERERQEYYRDARFTGEYDKIWRNVGKCVFCEPKEKYIFYEESGMYLAVALYAYVDGHLMIVPRRHVRSVKELTPLEWETVRKLMYVAKKLIRELHGVRGVQFIQKDGVDAQSTVEHIHFHAVPFDSPDLSVWNYRKLKHTPLENAEIYRNAGKKIDSLTRRYDEKYAEGA